MKPGKKPAPSPLAVQRPGNPEAEARALRKIQVEAVLNAFREELPALRSANPYVDVRDLVGSLHGRYEAELTAITMAEEAIDAGKQ